MDAEWVEVFHGSHRETVVVGITNHLKFYFLPTLQRLFHKNLRSKSESTLSDFLEFLLVGTDTRTESSKCVSRTNHDRETNAVCCCQRILHRFHSLRDWSLQLCLIESLHKAVSVFCVHDSFHRCTQDFYTIFSKCAILIQFRSTIQSGLSTESQEDSIRTLLLDDFSDEIRSDGLEIDFVSDTFRSLNSGNVRIDKHWAHTFLSQSLQRLRARIVKFTCLSDFQCARTQNEHLTEFLFHK